MKPNLLTQAPTPENTEPSVFPASACQVRYFEQERLSGPSSVHNVAVRRRIDGTISDASLQRALQALVRRHEILRTTLIEREGCVLQCVAPSVELRVQVEDLSALAGHVRELELERVGRAEALRPFELKSAPLMRAVLLRLDPSLAVLHLTFHEAVIDGWSLGVLLRELGMLAAAFDAGTALVLPQVDLHYGDYARWQADLRELGAFDADRDFWRAQLAGMTRFELPPDAAVGGTAAQSEIRSQLLPRELTAALDANAQASGQTLFTLALAALCAVLERATQAGEVVLSTQVAGRDTLATESVVGPLVNSLVLRIETLDDPTLDELAQRARRTLEDALAHQSMPFELLLEELGSPLTSVNFILQKAQIAAAQVGDSEYGTFRLNSIPAYPTGTPWDLNFFMVGREEGWRISCEADPGRFAGARIEQLLEQWQAALQLSAAAPNARVSALHGGGAQPQPRARPVRDNPRRAALLERIIPIHADGHKTPVLVLNNTAVLFPLARALGEERPLFDLQLCPAASPQQYPYRDFRDLARDVVEMVRLCRPHGPYILMGLCVFGSLALEAAQQLRAEGERVELVVVNDTWAPGYREDMPWSHRKLRAWRVRSHNVRLDLQRVQQREKTLSQVIASFSLLRRLKLVDAGIKLRVLEQGADEHVMRLENRWYTDYLLASQRLYRAAPYPGDVLVCRSQEPLSGRFFARDLGWGSIVKGRLDVIDCPGMHAEMYRAAGSEIIAAGMRMLLGDV